MTTTNDEFIHPIMFGWHSLAEWAEACEYLNGKDWKKKLDQVKIREDA